MQLDANKPKGLSKDSEIKVSMRSCRLRGAHHLKSRIERYAPRLRSCLEHDARNCDNFSGADQISMQIYFLESEFNNKFKENEMNDAWGFISM
jgi:hypothetical protein